MMTAFGYMGIPFVKSSIGSGAGQLHVCKISSVCKTHFFLRSSDS